MRPRIHYTESQTALMWERWQNRSAACRSRGRARCRRSGAWSRRRPARTDWNSRCRPVGPGMPMPVSRTEAQADCRRRRSRGRPARDHDLAALGELHGVADEVDEHLAQPRGIAAQRSPGTSASIIAGQLEALLGAPSARTGRATSSTRSRRSKRRRSSSQLARLDLGEVEDVVDDRRAATSPLVRIGLDVVALLGGERGVEQQARSCR